MNGTCDLYISSNNSTDETSLLLGSMWMQNFEVTYNQTEKIYLAVSEDFALSKATVQGNVPIITDLSGFLYADLPLQFEITVNETTFSASVEGNLNFMEQT